MEELSWFSLSEQFPQYYFQSLGLLFLVLWLETGTVVFLFCYRLLQLQLIQGLSIRTVKEENMQQVLALSSWNYSSLNGKE